MLLEKRGARIIHPAVQGWQQRSKKTDAAGFSGIEQRLEAPACEDADGTFK
jgi:hypothetical protein